eukprot:scaffold83378_cov52-Phaeocystis_antarctica.AAC.2
MSIAGSRYGPTQPPSPPAAESKKPRVRTAAHARRKAPSVASGHSSGCEVTRGSTSFDQTTCTAPTSEPLASRSPLSSSYTLVPRSASSSSSDQFSRVS